MEDQAADDYKAGVNEETKHGLWSTTLTRANKLYSWINHRSSGF